MPRLNRLGLVSTALSAMALLAMPTLSMAAVQVRAPGEPPKPETAEAGLWGLFDRTEIAARARADLNRDPELNAYVSQLTCRLAGDHCSDIRVYVMDRPVLNAGAGANGYVEVWSGLMLRASTEDELAFVLGHEIAHFLEEHSYETLRRQKIISNTVMVVGFGAAAAGVYYQVDVGDLIDAVYLAGVSNFFAFSQGQESQSDRMGLELAHKAGFDASAGAMIWRNQKEETAASSFRRVRMSDASGSAFRTHPLTQVRIGALETQAKQVGFAGTTLEDRQHYRTIIRPHLQQWLEDEHRHRDFGRLLHLLDRLAADDEDLGVINYHRGETYRRRREGGDDLLSANAYRVAVQYADAPVAAYRELGNLEARLGNADAARNAFNQYIALAPQADDLWIVEDQLSRLEGDSI